MKRRQLLIWDRAHPLRDPYEGHTLASGRVSPLQPKSVKERECVLEQALLDLGAAGCVVLGDPAYCGRFGFKAEPCLVLAGVPTEYFQVLSFAGRTPAVTVGYHPAFGTGS